MHLRACIFLCLLGYAMSTRRSVQISCKQIHELVDGHNERRLRLANGAVSGQPPAKEMKYMVWDDELAAKATKWASRNTFMHNPDNTIGSGRFTTGENLFMFSTTDANQKFNVDSALDSWFNEYKSYTYGPLKSSDFGRPDGVQIGHYTQMAWSDSIYVGCGISQFSKQSGWHSYLIVCNYGPAGNYLGRVPYRSGDPSRHLTCSIGDCSRRYGDKC